MKSTFKSRRQVTTPTYAVSYNPQGFWGIYGAAGVPEASNASIAIMAEGHVTGVISDLRIAGKSVQASTSPRLRSASRPGQQRYLRRR